MSKLTDDDKLDIIIQYEAGVKTSKIAMQYKINTSGVTKLMRRYKEYGIDGILVKHTKRYFDDDFKNEVLRLVDNGETLDVIALKYNIDHSTINNWIKKRNEKKYEIVYNTSIEGISDTMKDKEIKGDLSTPLTDEERKELIELRKKNKQLEMENEILKKLRALVQQRMDQQKKKK